MKPSERELLFWFMGLASLFAVLMFMSMLLPLRH